MRSKPDHGGHRGPRRRWRTRGAGAGRPSRGRAGTPPRRAGSLSVRPIEGDLYELVHPSCVEERRPDYEEGLEIWKAGEPEEARDALRYALEGCPDNLWIHVALGRIALESFQDATLARGHFGYAVELVQRAIGPGFQGRLPAERPANRPFFEALDGLIACGERLGQAELVAEIRRLRDRFRGPS